MGCGLIAVTSGASSPRQGGEVEQIALFDSTPGETARFAAQAIGGGLGARALHAATPEAVVRTADVVVFATTAGTPHLHDPASFDHRPLVLHISLRDLSPRIVLGAQNVVDDIDHVLSANTLGRPRRADDGRPRLHRRNPG